ncbi:MAG: hypothetical protein VYD64_05135 [Pseudomonadota bacterium]|nr:hypothetical protein [Pseudomonadota bacterium]
MKHSIDKVFRRAAIAAGMAAGIALSCMSVSASVAPLTDATPAASPTDTVPVFQAEPLLPQGLLKLAFSDSATNQVVNRLRQAESECGQLAAEYRADCLSQGYRSAASATRNKPDYSTAATQLNGVSRSLSGLVAQNVDPQAPAIRKGGKTYRAVKKSAVRTVNAKATAVIKEAETKLLRSASSGLRKVNYQRIAQAVGSTKKILRS